MKTSEKGTAERKRRLQTDLLRLFQRELSKIVLHFNSIGKWLGSSLNELEDEHMNHKMLLALLHSPHACLHINSRLRVEAKCFLIE